MDDAREIAGRLSAVARHIILAEGLAGGKTPFYAPIMRPLERKGLFKREDVRGFQVRWHLTTLGLQVRQVLQERQDATD